MKTSVFLIALPLLLLSHPTTGLSAESAASSLTLHARSRGSGADGESPGQVKERQLQWDPARTAIIVCDMWDHHWCQGASARVAEMAPAMNRALGAARARGVTIIHAPSDTMKAYEDAPQRQRARQTPKPANAPNLGGWCSLVPAKEGRLPIDDSDGGCDDDPPCKQGSPWRGQIASLEIAPEDYLTDRGNEVWAILEQKGIRHVMVMGVHINMCVLGRSFAIRQLVTHGKEVVLVRDLTDSMYNSRRPPYVTHCAGTDLMVAHIERHWCPSITSADLTGGEPFRFKADR